MRKIFLLIVLLLFSLSIVSYAQMSRESALKQIEILEATKEPIQGPKPNAPCPYCKKYTAIYTSYQISGYFASYGTYKAIYDCPSCGRLTLFKSTIYTSGKIDNIILYQGLKRKTNKK